MEEKQKFEKAFGRVKQATGWKTQQQLCDFFEITSSAVSGVKKRDTFPTDWAFKIAQDFNVSTDWILTGKGPMRSGWAAGEKQNHPLSEIQRMPDPEQCTVDAFDKVAIPQWKHPDPELFDYVPLVETQLSAGGGAYVVSEDIEGFYSFRISWLRRIASCVTNLVLMRVMGNSMSPTIQADDIVMVDMGRRPIDEGMVYALRFESTVMIKRLALRPGGRVQITSDNRLEFDPYEADVKDLHIIGKIIFFSRTFTG